MSMKSGIGISNFNRSIMKKINKKSYEVGSSEAFQLTLEKVRVHWLVEHWVLHSAFLHK